MCRSSNHTDSPLRAFVVPHLRAVFNEREWRTGSQFVKGKSPQKKIPNKQVTRRVQSLGLEFVSLSPILERGAKEGRLLYFPLDPHWNSEGTELVADYVADYFKTKYLSSAN